MDIGRIFTANPLAWLGLAAFLFAEYSLYRTGEKLTSACEYILPETYIVKAKPQTLEEEIIAMCDNRLGDDEPSREW